MLTYQKNKLLGLLAQLEAQLYECESAPNKTNNEVGKIFYETKERIKIIFDNITSIKKQIQRL